MPPGSRKPKGNLGPYPPGWEPFLASINAEQEEDTPRLVFADWLQENGDEPRAEFIRLQCDLARGVPADADRAESLLAEHRKRWLRGYPRVVIDNPERCQFTRGFVSSLSILGPRWAADGDTIRSFSALEELKIEQVWYEMLLNRSFEGLSRLAMRGVISALVETLARSPIIPTLQSLTLIPRWGVRVSQRSIRKLLENPKLTCLRRLSLESMPVGNAAVRVLTTAPHITALEALRLIDCEIDSNSVAELAALPNIANLRSLCLSGDVTDEGIRHITRSKYLNNLTELELQWCQLTPQAAQLLARWEGLRSVRHLDLRNNHRLRASELQLIQNSPHAVNLIQFNVT